MGNDKDARREERGPAVLSLLAKAGAAATAATGPENALAEIVAAYYSALGDRKAHERPGALKAGEQQYFVGGAFMVTPDRQYHMLVGNSGFPVEQRRLMIPIDAGHPGHVCTTEAPLLLENTDDHVAFRQYLRSSRMGSSIFAPMMWQGQFLGQVVLAAQARWTMRQSDLDVLIAIAPLATGTWIAHGGPEWLTQEYPPTDADRMSREGIG